MAYVVLFFVQVLFSINYFTSKNVLKYIPPLTFSSWRFLIAGPLLILLAILLKKHKTSITIAHRFMLLKLSLLGMAAAQGLFMLGLKRTTANNAAVVLSLAPIITFIIALITKQSTFSWKRLIGLFLSFGSIIILKLYDEFSFSSEQTLGDFLIFLCACFTGIYLNWSKRFFSSFPSILGSGLIFIISGMALIPFVLFLDGTSFYATVPWNDFSLVGNALFTIIGATLVTYFLINWSLTKVSPEMVSLFINLQGLLTSLWSFVFFDKALSWNFYAAVALNAFGMYLCLFSKKSPKRNSN